MIVHHHSSSAIIHHQSLFMIMIFIVIMHGHPRSTIIIHHDHPHHHHHPHHAELGQKSGAMILGERWTLVVCVSLAQWLILGVSWFFYLGTVAGKGITKRHRMALPS